MKRCSKCKQIKPCTEFHRAKKRKDGLYPQCKVCRTEAAEARRDVTNHYKREWYIANRDRLLEKAKTYQVENIGAVSEYKKQHYKENDALYKSRATSNRQNRKLADPERFNKQEADRMANWRRRNPHITAWRAVLRNCLIRMGTPKTDTTRTMLGYSAAELKSHLESLWSPGMSWNNYGEWQIDHIKSVSNFPSNTPASVVNALSNLRPMWATTRIVNGVLYEGNLNRRNKDG